MKELLDGFKAFLSGEEHELRKNNAYYAMLILTIVNVLLHICQIVFVAIFLPNKMLLGALAVGTLVCCLAFYLIMIDRGYKGVTEYMLSSEIFIVVSILCLYTKTENLFAFYIFLGIFPHYFYTDVKLTSKIVVSIIGLTFFNVLVIFKPVLPGAVVCNHPYLLLFLTANTFAIAIIFETFLSLVAVRNNDVVYIASMQNAEKRAMIDQLTGLWNRRYLVAKEAKIREQAEANSLCVAMLDIDYFKRVNDTYSHEAGDALLKHLADLMLKYFRQTDTSIRWGGEEFLLILTGMELAQAGDVMDKFRISVSKSPVKYNETEIFFTFTCGIAEIKPDSPIEKCINKADERLYLGKQSGRNKVVIENKIK